MNFTRLPMIIRLSFITLFSIVFTSQFALAKKRSIEVQSNYFFFSPNKDGIQDDITIYAKIVKFRKIQSWKLEYKDSTGYVRKTESGAKSPPSTFLWSGLDDFGIQSPEGSYEVLLTVWDKKGKTVISPPLQIIKDLTPPTISLSAPKTKIYIENYRIPPIAFNFSAVDLSGIFSWEIELADDANQQFYTEYSSSPLPSAWTFSTDQAMIPFGKVYATLSVTDQAGNKSNSMPLEIEIIDKDMKATQSPEVKSDPKITVPANTAVPLPEVPVQTKTITAEKYQGNVLQLTSILFINDLFGKNATNKSQLLPQASVLLDPLANTLINSPGSFATILGHVERQSNTTNTKALSSYFAWRVFSYFVKQKGLPKSIITVKGMGSNVPIADNTSSIGKSQNRRIEIQLFLPSDQ